MPKPSSTFCRGGAAVRRVEGGRGQGAQSTSGLPAWLPVSVATHRPGRSHCERTDRTRGRRAAGGESVVATIAGGSNGSAAMNWDRAERELLALVKDSRKKLLDQHAERSRDELHAAILAVIH